MYLILSDLYFQGNEQMTDQFYEKIPPNACRPLNHFTFHNGREFFLTDLKSFGFHKNQFLPSFCLILSIYST